MKLEQSVQVLQLGKALAEQDAAQAHRSIEVGHTVCVWSTLYLTMHMLDFIYAKTVPADQPIEDPVANLVYTILGVSKATKESGQWRKYKL